MVGAGLHLRPELLRMQRQLPDKYRFPAVRLLLQAVGTEGIGFASLPLPLPALATEEPPLWGLTLTLTSDVLTRAGAATLVGPGAAVPAFSHPFGIAGGTIGDDMIRVMLMARKHQRALSRLLGPLLSWVASPSQWHSTQGDQPRVAIGFSWDVLMHHGMTIDVNLIGTGGRAC